MCSVCFGKRYIIAERDDGRFAVERCDGCSAQDITDSDAAKLAQADGIACASSYPCILVTPGD